MVAVDRVRKWWAPLPAIVKGLVTAVSVATTIFVAGGAFVILAADQRELPKRMDVAESRIDSIFDLLVPVSCFTKANADLPGYTRDGCALNPKP